MKLRKLEKKIRVGLHWALNIIFERDLVQYATPQDIDSVHRPFGSVREPGGAACAK